MDSVPSSGWLTQGGTYALIGLAWILAGVLYANIGYRLGRKHESPNDGCMLQLGTQVLILVGGSLGFFLAPFPWFILTSTIGAFLAPALICVMFDRKMSNQPK